MRLTQETFNEIAKSVWYARLGGKDEDIPDIPSVTEFQRALIDGDLDDGLTEFHARMHDVVEVSLSKFMGEPLTLKVGSRIILPLAMTDLILEIDRDPTLLENVGDMETFIIALGLGVFHAEWEAKSKRDPEVKHPLASLIEAWFKLPRRVEPVRKPTGIAPRFASIRDRRHKPILLEQLPDLPGPQGNLTAYLPGLEPRPQRMIAAPELHLFDFAGGTSMKKGRAAPISLRLFFELLMSVPLEARDFDCRLEVSLRDLRDWFYPPVERADGESRSSYKPSKHLPLIHRGIHEVHNLYVEATPKGAKAPEAWHPIVARSRPLRDLNSQARFLIDLPPGSTRGALIDRRVARVLGLKSALHYRAYISLCYFWDYYGHTENGKRSIQSTRPLVARNSNGLIVDRQGMPMLDRAGKPIKRWKQGIPLDKSGRPTSWKYAEREINPEGLRRYPVLTDDDLMDLCYSTLDGGTVTGNTLLQRLHRSKDALRDMRDQGYIILVEDAVNNFGDRKGWQILPP